MQNTQNMRHDIEIKSFGVIDAHRAMALLHIDPNATAGPRNFRLFIDDQIVATNDDFIVQSAGDRPVVLGAHPTSVRQGARTTVFIDMSSPEDMTRAPPIVNLGEGIIIEEVVRRSSGIDVQLSVAHDAPLGPHPIEVDEVDRVLTGATLEVRDTPKVPERNCSSTSRKTVSPWLCMLTFLTLLRRRENAQ